MHTFTYVYNFVWHESKWWIWLDTKANDEYDIFSTSIFCAPTKKKSRSAAEILEMGAHMAISDFEDAALLLAFQQALK